MLLKSIELAGRVASCIECLKGGVHDRLVICQELPVLPLAQALRAREWGWGGWWNSQEVRGSYLASPLNSAHSCCLNTACFFSREASTASHNTLFPWYLQSRWSFSYRQAFGMVTATSAMVSGFARHCKAALPVVLTWLGAWNGKGDGRCTAITRLIRSS